MVERGERRRFCSGWGPASRPGPTHACHLVSKGHGLVRVLRCDVRHNIMQKRGLLSALWRGDRAAPPPHPQTRVPATQSFYKRERPVANACEI